MRYCFVFTARCAAASGLSAAPECATITSFASGSDVSARAISSRQPLASLSTRTGRLRSRVNDRLHRGRVGGGGGGGGGRMVTVVLAEAALPRSSTTLHVR